MHVINQSFFDSFAVNLLYPICEHQLGACFCMHADNHEESGHN